MRVDTTRYHSNRDTVNVDGRQVAQFFAMLVVYLHKQLHVGKFAQQYVYETVGQMRVCSQSVSREGFQAGSEVLADAAHEQ